MRLTDAWLVLIAGVSLLSLVVSAEERLELNEKTCNLKKPGTSIPDPDAFMMKCFLPNECTTGVLSEWNIGSGDILNTCKAIIAIRPSPDGKQWMVVLQVRGSILDHLNEGISFYEKTTSPDTKKLLVKCHQDGDLDRGGNKVVIESHPQNGLSIDTIRTSVAKDDFSLCEVVISHQSMRLKDIFKGKLGFSWKVKATAGTASEIDLTDLKLTNTDRCDFPKLYSYNELAKDPGDYYVKPSIWERQLECNAPGESFAYSDRFVKKFVAKHGIVHEATSITCIGAVGNFHYEAIDNTTTKQELPPLEELTAACVVKACTLCALPKCLDEPCPTLGIDDEGCATPVCPDPKIYVVNEKTTGTPNVPKCKKIEERKGNDKKEITPLDKQDKGLEDKLVEWRSGDGERVTKIRCGFKIGCTGDKLNFDGDKDKMLEIGDYNATCKEGKKLRIVKDGDDVNLKLLDCNIANGVWSIVKENGNSSTYDNSTLKCHDPDPVVAPAGAQTQLVAIGGGVGGFALLVIIIVIVWFCCCRRRKKKADTKASMTAVSSGDPAKKSSEIKSDKSAPKSATPSIPVAMEPMKPPPPPPRSDNVPETKKEETKKEFLKFDDSNISDIQQVSKKHEETERLDVLQQEAEKLSVEQKQKAEARKKAERDLYPRLADIDDDWNNSEEKKIDKAKKPAVPSDKTTIMSKLTSNGMPLQNAPHDDGQYEALGMPTVMVEKTAIEDKTKTNEDESGTSKKSTKTRTKMQVPGEASEKKSKNTELQTALDAKLAEMEKAMEKTAILNEEEEEGETQKATNQTRTMMTGKTKATNIAGTQSKDRTTMGTTQGGLTTQRIRTQTQTRTRGDPTQATQTRTKGDPTQGTQTRTRGDPTQVPSFEGFTARDPTAGDETQAGTDGTQLTDGRTGREMTANDVTQGTDGRTAQALTPVDFTQEGRTRTGRTAKELTAADFTQNRTRTPTGRTAITKTRATRTQDQTTRTADQETQDPTAFDQTQLLTRTRRTSRTQDGTAFEGTQDPTAFDQTQAGTDGRTGRTRGASRTQMTRTGTTQDPTAFDGTQDPTAFDQTQLTAGGRTSRTQDRTRTLFDGTQDPTAFDQTQMTGGGRTRTDRTRATMTGATQDPTAFDGTQDPTAFDQTQMTGGGRTRTDRTRATMTGATQDPTAFDGTQAPSTDGRTGVTRTRARTTQDTRDPTGTQDPTAFDQTQMTAEGRTAVTKTRASRTQDQTAFDGTQAPTEGQTAVSRTKGRTTQDGTMAFDGTQQPTDGKTAVSRTKGRTTQGETTAADGTQLQTDGRTAVSRTKGRTTQDGTTMANDGTQLPTDGKTAVSRTKGRTTQGETTAADGTQLQTDGRTAVSRTKGRTTQDGTTMANDGTQLPTDGKTAVSRTKGRTTQDGTTAVADGTQVQTDGRTAVSRTKGRTTQDGTAVADGTQVQTPSKTKGSRTQEPTTAATRAVTSRTQEQTAAGTQEATTAGNRTGKERTKSQSGTKTPNDTQADGQTADPKERTKSKEKATKPTGASQTGPEGPQTQSRTGAEGQQSAPSEGQQSE